jgi:hypothetical protein
MKSICKIVWMSLILCCVAASAIAQEEAPPAALTNLTDGAGSITGGAGSWGGFTALSTIPGAGLFTASAKTTSLYIGFTGGNTVDVGNLVLYKTNRSSSNVISAKKVTLGGVANPTINLTSTSVCPVQPVSLANPCIIRLDPVKGALSTLSDYTFAIYLPNDSNNSSVQSAGRSSAQGSLSGWYASGDQTKIKKNKPLPSGNSGGAPYFLLYVNNQ